MFKQIMDYSDDFECVLENNYELISLV